MRIVDISIYCGLTGKRIGTMRGIVGPALSVRQDEQALRKAMGWHILGVDTAGYIPQRRPQLAVRLVEVAMVETAARRDRGGLEPLRRDLKARGRVVGLERRAIVEWLLSPLSVIVIVIVVVAGPDLVVQCGGSYLIVWG